MASGLLGHSVTYGLLVIFGQLEHLVDFDPLGDLVAFGPLGDLVASGLWLLGHLVGVASMMDREKEITAGIDVQNINYEHC